jgi:hypothetical protein
MFTPFHKPPYTYPYDRSVDETTTVDYSLIAPEASMAMKKTSGGDSPLRQGAGKSFWTLPISGRRRRRIAMCF